MPRESKCWTCPRAYAKPDPQGCAWIRHHIQVWEKAVIEPMVSSESGISYDIYIVTKCSQGDEAKKGLKNGTNN